MAVGSATECRRCGLLYNPAVDYGVWECRVHRLPLDVLTGRYLCCGVQTRSSLVQRDFPIATAQTTADDYLGCHRADHDLDLAKMPWPPIELCRSYTKIAQDALRQRRTDTYADGQLVLLSDYASYQAYGRYRPTFGQMMATIPTAADFVKNVRIPLLLDTLTDADYHLDNATRPAMLVPTMVRVASHLIEVLRIELTEAAQLARRLNADGRVTSIEQLVRDVTSRLPDLRIFWFGMGALVAVLFQSLDNPIPPDVRMTIAREWASTARLSVDDIPLYPVLRAEKVQDAGTLYRARSMARDIATYATSS